MSRTFAPITILVLTATAACGGAGPNGGTATEAEARRAWDSTAKALEHRSEANSNIAPVFIWSGGQPTPDSAGCGGGGGVSFDTGTLIENALTDPTDFAFNVSLADCIEDGLPMSGAIYYEGDIDIAGAAVSVTLRYIGTIEYGDGIGACDIDLSIAVNTANMGMPTVEGSFCGHPASLVSTIDALTLLGDLAGGIGGGF